MNIPTSPSHEPESKTDKFLGCLAIQFTPSVCPSKELTNGLAKTRSSLTAFNARVYSRGPSKGCNDGSRLRWSL